MEEQKLYLLGHPISHSKSPAMYNDVYGRLGLPWCYDIMDCPTIREAQEFLNRHDFLSINVTTPYKPEAFDAADVKAASATLAEGANVLVNHKHRLLAYNTDGEGCVAYLERIGFYPLGKRVVVCGTGPTALSILHAMALAGAEEIILVGRDRDRSRKVLEDYVDKFAMMVSSTIDLPAARRHHLSFREAYEQVELKFGSYSTSTQAISQADLIVNATPLGMKAGDPAPFDENLFSDHQFAFDVVYGHGTTAFIAGATQAGARCCDGSGMLVGQAVRTVGIVCDIADVALPYSDDELFDLMAHAAGFTHL